MGRSIRALNATWIDRECRKSIKALSKADKKAYNEELSSFLDDLSECSHPTASDSMAKWRPTGYPGTLKVPGGQLIEYRLSGLTRVVVCWFGEESSPHHDTVLLLTITLDHDHRRMQRLLDQHQASIRESAE